MKIKGKLKIVLEKVQDSILALVIDAIVVAVCEATLCHPHRRRFEISRNSDGDDALVATRRSNARRDDALSLPCLMPGILPDMRQGHDVKP